ncbi:hypothetical protein Cgig2_009784 [Carnegiea gigantea]|uniref:Uncharacterized protein n=1 Tax=Carnegiea gigantea TaxID=171969 RepID=A0A9Q1JQ80_9CARY|nr:hypothetical protein Cgig2_009784 [Carnegiea gigantea]
MQEVGDDKQPLYARLVVPNLSAMVAVLSGQSKAKFSINGKHVWARKYVAMHIAAFWLWLECFNNHPHYVDNILNLPNPLLEAALEEMLLCLRATQVDPGAGFRPPNSDPLDIPLMHSITRMDWVSPWFFHKYLLSYLRYEVHFDMIALVNPMCVSSAIHLMLLR